MSQSEIKDDSFVTGDYYELDGLQVTTATKHAQKGKCCKCYCLHCPFGFTLKHKGLTIKQLPTESKLELELLAESKIDNSNPESIRFFYLKDYLAGVCRIDHIQIKQLYLGKYFRDQDLTKEYIERYLF